MKIKHIRGITIYKKDGSKNHESFENRLNKALKDIPTKNIIDIKYSSTPHQELDDTLFTALIIYK
jgi:hypothetical protein|tara:strand:+ start:281 stop:475 length:195 start_codon:yes stop_codon:yes gene_type:complete